MSIQKSTSERQISVAGVMAYTALWALGICLLRQAIKLQQGTHTIAEAQLSNILMLVVSGMLFVAIGLPISVAVGRTRQSVPIAIGCFFVGILAIPTLSVILVALGSLGFINLDL